MNCDFWLERWRDNNIGFHQQEFNRYLTRYWRNLDLPSGSRVFVPLCGKSLDMLWLKEQGHHVIGIELSDIAVKQFFIENGLDCRISQLHDFTRYESEGLELWQGDLFNAGPLQVDKVTAIFDRASLVALPPSMRLEYAQHLIRIMPGPIKMLLVAFEYDQDKKSGPPFAVSEAEIQALYQNHFHLELLECQDVLAQYPAIQADGLEYLREKVYLLTSKQTY